MNGSTINYRTMRCSIPEGGEVVLHVPRHIGPESFDIAAECIALQMRIFKRHFSNAIDDQPPAQEVRSD